MVEGSERGKKERKRKEKKKKGILIHLRGVYVRAPEWGYIFSLRAAGHERTLMKSILHLTRP
jgi:hypothetical protein